MIDATLVLQVLINGLVAGGILALIAVGYNLIYGILRFINFAHGEILTLSAFLMFFFYTQQQLPLIVAVILTILCGVIAGVLLNKLVYAPLRNASPMSLLVAAVAASLIIQALILLFFSSDVKIPVNPIEAKPIQILGASITPAQLIVIISSILLSIATYWLLAKTKVGKEIRATAENPELAKTIGIDTEKVINYAFILASTLASIAGILVTFIGPIHFILGVNIGIQSFASTVIGGIGSVYGAFLGAYILGLVENLGILVIPSSFKLGITFVLLAAFLIFKPKGIIENNLRRG